MTENVISTSEINRLIKKFKPPKVYTVNDLKKMGFEPTFITTHGTYWLKEVIDEVIQTLLGNRDKELIYQNEINEAFITGYKKGRKEGIESGMRNMHSLLIEYLMDTHNELVQEIQYVSDGFLKPMIPVNAE